MLKVFFTLILRLNESFLLELSLTANFPLATAKECAEFSLQACKKMQAWIRLALALILLIFELSSMMRFGRPFSRLSLKERAVILHYWRNSRFGYKRKFLSLMHNLFLFSISGKLVGKMQYQEYEQVQRFYQGI